jgi:hypothetical protein
MPPINTQGSRAPLITTLVVFTILFVTATIFAIYFNVQLQESQRLFNDYKKNYNGVVADTAFNTPEFTALKTLAADQSSGFNRSTVLDIALKQRNDLAQAITGTPATDAAPAQKAAADTLAATAAKLKQASVSLALPPTGLTGAINTLAGDAVAKQQKIGQLNAELAAAQKSLKDANDGIAAASAKRDKDLADARAQDEAALQKVNDQFKANSDMIAQLQKDEKDQQDKSQTAAQAAQTQLAKFQQQLTKAAKDLTASQAKLVNHRVNPDNAAIRQADGKIVRLPGNNICYINLGQGDQVSPGLTFEVYDKATGIPPIPPNANGDEQLPVGKASIEITRVGATSSECRIVQTAPGAILSEGDLIENLVYDPNTKYNFFVYGNFDLAQTGRANPADEAVIKRLVTQWGGKLADQVNVDTDFVVLGKEPVLPNFSKEELQQPLNQDKLDKAQKELDQYQQISQTARELHIPILNQNRFLYYVGYYDQAKR